MAGLGDALGKIGNAADIQKTIDAELARRVPGFNQYVEYVRYVPQGGEVPGDASHVLSFTSQHTQEAIIVALKTKGIYGMLVDGLLAVL